MRETTGIVSINQKALIRSAGIKSKDEDQEGDRMLRYAGYGMDRSIRFLGTDEVYKRSLEVTQGQANSESTRENPCLKQGPMN